MGSGDAGILIVEDEPELVRALRINPHARQYHVRTAGTNYLRFHMARLRRKLEDNPARPGICSPNRGWGTATSLDQGLSTTFPLIGHACFARYSAECEARDLPWGADEATGRGRSARDR